MKLIDKRNLSYVDNEYIDGALNGGDTLRRTYEDKIRKSIENGDLQWWRWIKKVCRNNTTLSKNIAIPVEDNRQNKNYKK